MSGKGVRALNEIGPIIYYTYKGRKPEPGWLDRDVWAHASMCVRVWFWDDDLMILLAPVTDRIRDKNTEMVVEWWVAGKWKASWRWVRGWGGGCIIRRWRWRRWRWEIDICSRVDSENYSRGLIHTCFTFFFFFFFFFWSAFRWPTSAYWILNYNHPAVSTTTTTTITTTTTTITTTTLDSSWVPRVRLYMLRHTRVYRLVYKTLVGRGILSD